MGKTMKKFYGFNMQWFFSLAQEVENAKKDGIALSAKKITEVSKKDIDLLLPRLGPDGKALNFIKNMGCNFVRIPLDYRFWIQDFAYDAPYEAVLEKIDACVEAVVSHGLFCSLNIHRAPGYCINNNDEEKHNLWTDKIAQDAFVLQWEHFAKRYSSYSEDQLEFDLLNEPPNIDQYGLTRDIHADLMKRTAQAIWAIDPKRPITIDGLGGGNIAMPELSDAGFRMSTRGYQPMPVSHYQASWCAETQGLDYPVYPGTEFDGKIWTIDTIRDHYRPWKELSDKGVPVYIGEFGCYNKINNDLALRWFTDIFTVFNENGWGYVLWEFDGEFGIIGHNRPGTRYETIDGYEVDIDLYNLFKKGMKNEK